VYSALAALATRCDRERLWRKTELDESQDRDFYEPSICALFGKTVRPRQGPTAKRDCGTNSRGTNRTGTERAVDSKRG
jgi:hypothetical protein